MGRWGLGRWGLGIVAALAAASFGAMAPGGAVAAAEAVSAAERERIESVVRDYLLAHPEIIVEAIEKLQSREQAAEAERQRRSLAEHAAALYEHPLTPVSGAADGDVVLVEFFDYQCGYCKQVLPAVLDLLGDDRKLKVVWKELPILGPASVVAARAAMAADRQGRYLDFHRALMALRGPLSEDRVFKTAADVGLDMTKLRRDMAAPEIDAYLRETQQLAQALGINGTPAFVIDEQIYPGAVGADQMRALIADARNGAARRSDGGQPAR